MLCYGFFYYFALLLWLGELGPFLGIGGAGVLLLAVGLLVAALLEGTLLALACFVFPKLKRWPIIDIFTFAVLFTLGEWLQGVFPALPFPWGRLGNCMAGFLPFIQSASLFGSLFITFLLVALSGAIATALMNLRNSQKLIRALITVAVIFSINICYGGLRLILGESALEEKNKTSVLLVQGNFSGQDKWDATPPEMLAEYLRLTKAFRTADTELAVFPETAVPIDLEQNPIEKKLICDFAKKENVTILTGVNHYDGDDVYNSMIAVLPNGDISEPYSKQVLVPFGETVPLYSLLSSFTDFFDPYNSFAKGKPSPPIEIDAGRVGGIICYESIFSELSRRTVKDGAEILAVISNDSWFGDSPALYQHFSHSILRAVENKRYVLRASNTAVTAFVSPFGKVIKAAEPFVGTGISAEVSAQNEVTPYTKFGDIPLLVGAALFLLFVQFLAARNKA